MLFLFPQCSCVPTALPVKMPKKELWKERKKKLKKERKKPLRILMSNPALILEETRPARHIGGGAAACSGKKVPLSHPSRGFNYGWTRIRRPHSRAHCHGYQHHLEWEKGAIQQPSEAVQEGIARVSAEAREGSLEDCLPDSLCAVGWHESA